MKKIILSTLCLALLSSCMDTGAASEFENVPALSMPDTTKKVIITKSKSVPDTTKWAHPDLAKHILIALKEKALANNPYANESTSFNALFELNTCPAALKKDINEYTIKIDNNIKSLDINLNRLNNGESALIQSKQKDKSEKEKEKKPKSKK